MAISKISVTTQSTYEICLAAEALRTVWIDVLSRSGDDWLVITGDGRIQKNRAERIAFRKAGLKGFVLAPAYQGFKVNRQASFLLWRWPDIENIVRLTAAPFLFELPMHRSSRIRQLPL